MIFHSPQKKSKRKSLHPPEKKRARGSSAPISISPVQRKIGFEFEIGNWETKRPERRPSGELEWKPLQKDQPLLKSSFFELKADQTPKGSDLEIMTVAFDESKSGLEDLKEAARQIVRLVESLEPFGKKAEPLEKLRSFGEVVSPPGRILVDSPPLIKPQATFGLEMEAVPSLFADIGSTKETEGASLRRRRERGRRQLASSRPVVGSSDRIDEASHAAVSGIRALWEEMRVDFRPSPRLLALASLVCMYLIRGSRPIRSYPKTISALLSRTDFSALFQMLEPREKALFGPEEEGSWRRLYEHALRRLGIGLGGPVFEGVYAGDRDARHVMLRALKREDWLAEMTRGTDLLTASHFPAREHAGELESLGAWQGKTDPSALHPGQGMPIFELRSIRLLHDYHQIEPFVLDFFRYIYALNRKMEFKYGEDFPIT